MENIAIMETLSSRTLRVILSLFGSYPNCFQKGICLAVLPVWASEVSARAFPNGLAGQCPFSRGYWCTHTAAHQFLGFGKSFSWRDKKEREWQICTTINRTFFKILKMYVNICLWAQIFFNFTEQDIERLNTYFTNIFFFLWTY